MNPKGRFAKPPKARALILRAAYYIFLAFGVFALSYACYAIAEAHVYQSIEESKFATASRGNLGQNDASQAEERAPVLPGGAIGEMEIPRLGLSAIIVQGDSPSALRHAVGHLSETAFPGESGNVVLAGHRDTFFRPLRNIRQGDSITLKTLAGGFQYLVESTAIVSPSDTQVLQPSSGSTLTLVTCYPFYYVGPAPKRFVVRARLLEPPAK